MEESRRERRGQPKKPTKPHFGEWLRWVLRHEVRTSPDKLAKAGAVAHKTTVFTWYEYESHDRLAVDSLTAVLKILEMASVEELDDAWRSNLSLAEWRARRSPEVIPKDLEENRDAGKNGEATLRKCGGLGPEGEPKMTEQQLRARFDRATRRIGWLEVRIEELTEELEKSQREAISLRSEKSPGKEDEKGADAGADKHGRDAGAGG